MNSGTGASSTTVWRGDGTWAAPFSLTTTGTSGAATFSGGTLNIPNYATGGSGITFTDGTHTVTGSTQLTVSGGTIGGTTPNATLTVSGGGGSGGFFASGTQGGTISGSNTFFYPVGGVAGSGLAGSTNVDTPVARATTVANLYVASQNAPGTGNSIAVSVCKNDVCTSTPICTISNTSTTCNDTVNTSSFVAGDLIAFKLVSTTTAATRRRLGPHI